MSARKPLNLAQPKAPISPKAPSKPIAPKKPEEPKKPTPPTKPISKKVYYVYNPLITVWDLVSEDAYYHVIISTKAPDDCPILGNIIYELIDNQIVARNNLLSAMLSNGAKKTLRDHFINHNDEDLEFATAISKMYISD